MGLTQAHSQNRQVCCVLENSKNIIARDQRCAPNRTTKECCEFHLELPLDPHHLIGTADRTCQYVSLKAIMSEVEVCYSPTLFGEQFPLIGHGLDLTSAILRVRHSWIRTPTHEAGQGLSPGTISRTEWRDHHGFGEDRQADCFHVARCNRTCVEDSMILGKNLGFYSPLNTCHDVVKRTLDRCGCKDTCLRGVWPNLCSAWTIPP